MERNEYYHSYVTVLGEFNMKFNRKIIIISLILLLCGIMGNLVTAEADTVLNAGVSSEANVMSSSLENSGVINPFYDVKDNISNLTSNNLSGIMATLPETDAKGDVVNPSSDNLDSSGIMATLPDTDAKGDVVNPSSDNLDNSGNMATLPETDAKGDVVNPTSDNLDNSGNMAMLPEEENKGDAVSAAPNNTRTITDMRDMKVIIPAVPQRVVIIDTGLIAQSMRALGVDEHIVGSGGLLGVTGVNEDESDTVFLIPELQNNGDVGHPQEAGVDINKVAFSNPDLIIFLQSEFTRDNFAEKTNETINSLENLGIPFVVINGPGYAEPASSEQLYDALSLLGQIFTREDRAAEIISYLKEQEKIISDRTSSIPEDEKPLVLYLGLQNESAGVVWGGDYGDAKFSKSVAHITNVQVKEGQSSLSSENIVKLDPNVIILTPNIVLTEPDLIYSDAYSSLKDIDAIKNKQVGSLGKLTLGGDFKLNAPVILLISAKTAYPEEFSDLNVYDWLKSHYKELYGLTDTEAAELARIQHIDWMEDKKF
jgi:iron complex transport system substrate-binding protein